MKNRILLLLFLFFLLCSASCIFAVNDKIFTNEDLGISMSCPQDWVFDRANVKKSDLTNGPKIIALFARKDDPNKIAGSEPQGAYIGIMVAAAPETRTLLELTKSVIESGYKNAEEEFNNEPFQSININGQDSIKVITEFYKKRRDVVKASVEKVKFKSVNYHFLKNGVFVMVGCGAPIEEFDKYLPVFEQAVNTFKFE